jgi:hypothetical protein
MQFKLWLEQKEEYIKDAILGVFGGGLNISEKEKIHLMQRNTNEFSSEIIKKVKNLGVIKNIADDDMSLYIDIINAIKNGISIGDLIKKISGDNFAPNAAIE